MVNDYILVIVLIVEWITYIEILLKAKREDFPHFLLDPLCFCRCCLEKIDWKKCCPCLPKKDEENFIEMEENEETNDEPEVVMN